MDRGVVRAVVPRRVRWLGAALLLCAALIAGCAAAPEVQPPQPPQPVAIPAPAYVVEGAEPDGAAAPEAPAADAPAIAPESSAVERPKVTKAVVVRVVDGDTAVFRLDGGREEKVRFIGIDTPESTNKVEPYGKEASSYTKKALPVGSTVYLEKDAEERDRYGRLLAYVWLERPSLADEIAVRNDMLNAKLALDGYAQQMTIPPNVKYADIFGDCVREAREAESGLWSSAKATEQKSGEQPASAPVAASYIGNKNTMKFHEPGCSSVDQMNPSNKVALSSRDQAVSGGYVPCKRCNP